MLSFLIIGLFIGMAHAFETDHLAAIGTLASSGRATPGRLAFLGMSWGLGHTTTLLILSGAVLAFGAVLTDFMAAGIETGVGLMLVGLGVHVFWKMWRNRIHIHVHEHEDGRRHFHAHSHFQAQVSHANDSHDHTHKPVLSWRAYIIGLAHGAAGSAGLVALAAAATQDLVTAMSYVLVFGFGSIVGMATLTLAASWPLRWAEKTASGLLLFVRGGTGVVAIVIGLNLMVQSLQAMQGLG